MRLIATAKPTQSLLNMFNEFSPIPGDWIQQVCGDEVTAVRRAEYNEVNCEWAECIFVPSAQYLHDPYVRSTDMLIDRLRKDLGAVLTRDSKPRIILHGGVMGICTLTR